MCRPLRYIAIAAPAFFAIGCSEKADSPPTGPEFHTVINKSSGCDLMHLSQLANSYFSQPRQLTVKNLVDALSAAPSYSVDAKTSGFDIMAQVDSAVAEPSAGAPSIGSDLLNHLLLCMYDPSPTSADALSYPESFPEDFTVALTPTASAHGAFGQRSGTSTSPVLSRPISAPFTGIAPLTASAAWGSLVSNSPPRVVFYGRPATPADLAKQTYDWRTIPHNATFSSSIIIGFCVDQATYTTNMVIEQGVAVLAFADAYFLNPAAGTCSPDLALLGGSSPFQLAHRMLRFGTGLITPSPLMAAVLSPGGTGGASSKCCSKVGLKDVPSVSLTLSNVTTPVKVNTGRFSLTATTKSGTDPVNGVGISLATTTNSGTPTSIRVADPASACNQGPPPVGTTGTGTNAAGTYVFTNLCFTNTGNVYITGTANVNGRADTPVTTISNKINVKP